ncbi:MAG: hypothetical protein GY828_03600 [Candidatus Gracilibacteria bacterium]|nr:hypothetical protein [Candidatus Gracilibacteria bacterium]
MKNTHIIINAENTSEVEEFLKRSNFEYINRSQEDHEARIKMIEAKQKELEEMKAEQLKKESIEHNKKINHYKEAMKHEKEILDYYSECGYSIIDIEEMKEKEDLSQIVQDVADIVFVKFNSYIIIKDDAKLDREKIDIGELYHMYKLTNKLG